MLRSRLASPSVGAGYPESQFPAVSTSNDAQTHPRSHFAPQHAFAFARPCVLRRARTWPSDGRPPAGVMGRRSVAIVMYHKVAGAAADRFDAFLNTPAHQFRRQMGLLERLGYRGLTLTEAVEGLTGRAPLPDRAVCVTFDDGFSCVAEYALPVLQGIGWPGTVFVAPGWLGREYTHFGRAGNESDRIMDSDALRALRDQGWEIGGHTHTHALLGDLDDDDALHAITRGNEGIADAVGVRPRTFCYPGGSLNARTPGLVRQAGLVGACTTRSGLARAGDDPFLLRRVKPAWRDGVVGFVYRLFVRPYLP